VVLAGGAGRRLGGAKATVRLGERPLLAHPRDALREALGEVVVVAKATTALPSPVGAELWREPDAPVHPLAGIAWALRRASGRAVVVCALDLPFVPVALLRALATDSPEADAVIAAGQPLLGRYGPALEGALSAAVAAGRPARAAVADPERVLFNVNTPQDLARAEVILAGRQA